MSLKRTIQKLPFFITLPDGNALEIQVPACFDPSIGEYILTPEAMELIDQTKAKAWGVKEGGK